MNNSGPAILNNLRHAVPVTINIPSENGIIRINDLSQPVVLTCFIRGQARELTGAWVLPSEVGRVIGKTERSGRPEPIQTVTRNGDIVDVKLTILQPRKSDAGPYLCRSGGMEKQIRLVIEDAIAPLTLFVTSDNGISRVKLPHSQPGPSMPTRRALLYPAFMLAMPSLFHFLHAPTSAPPSSSSDHSCRRPSHGIILPWPPDRGA
ncbi:unnamed protein product [Protopolystoma xenopodis]|uniref:Ig-like domain-containing protein n=1 Tax=Protopolystoma xenopodis TaxID=117903 RepID=A0A3S5A856_9PLAT|nr:unnamed protein product [Protopolystoma xenopodis]